MGILGGIPKPWLMGMVAEDAPDSGGVRGWKVDGGEEASKLRPPEMEADGDLRWVPPWISKLLYCSRRCLSLFASKSIRRGGSLGTRVVGANSRVQQWLKSYRNPQVLPEDLGELLLKSVVQQWDLLLKSGKTKGKEQRVPPGLLLRAIVIEVSNLLGIQFLFAEVGWSLYFEQDCLYLDNVEIPLLSLNSSLERLRMVDGWIFWYYWVISCIYTRSGASHKLFLLTRTVNAIRALVRRSNIKENGGMDISRSIWPPDWVDVSFELGLLMVVCVVVACWFEAWFISFQVRFIYLQWFSWLVHGVYSWLNIGLFSVAVSTVHFVARSELVQCVWVYCSHLKWSCVSMIWYYANFAFHAMGMNGDLLEMLLISRNLVNFSVRAGNLVCVWVISYGLGQLANAWLKVYLLKIFNVTLVMVFVYIVLLWLYLCLFSVVVTTVHFRASYRPVQCVWIHGPSSLGKSCDLIFIWPTDYVCSKMTKGVLLEFSVSSRIVSRNHFLLWIPREAKLVADQITNASLDWSYPLDWACRPPSQLKKLNEVADFSCYSVESLVDSSFKSILYLMVYFGCFYLVVVVLLKTM